MDTRTITASRTLEAIVRVCHAGYDSRTLRVETLKLLRRVIPVDAFWFATADPATLLFTSSVIEEIPEHATSAFVANEFLQDDVNKWVGLTRSNPPVGGLYAATRGKPADSPRFSEILAPLGFGDELRVALMDGTSCWGFICMHRERSSPAFTSEDAAYVSRLAPHLAEGLRTALLIDYVGVAPESDAPGLVVVADDLSVAAVTPSAERWLAELADWPVRDELPQIVHGVVAKLRAIGLGDDASHMGVPRVRVRTRSGQWLVLHASRLSGPESRGQTAVIMEIAQPLEVAPLILRAYSLTEREVEVVQFVLQGQSTAEISAELFISPLTVQQHLKAVFDKAGVRSRRELVAQIFSHQYLPHLMAGSRIGPDGWFASP